MLTRTYFRRRAARGFSMIETLIVLALIGVLATMGFTMLLAARPHVQLERGEVAVVSYLNDARGLAVSEEARVRVIFDAGSATMETDMLPPGAVSWVTARPDRVLPEGVEFGTITFAANTVEFTTRGSLVAGGTVALESSTGETFTLNSNLATGKFAAGQGNTR
jgi:prepilin-type N-terminal cleavage/methylation domain-containing protein